MDVKMLAALMRSQMLSSPLLSDSGSTGGGDSQFSALLSAALLANGTQTSDPGTMPLLPPLAGNSSFPLNSASGSYDDMIAQTADRYGLEPSLLRSVIR